LLLTSCDVAAGLLAVTAPDSVMEMVLVYPLEYTALKTPAKAHQSLEHAVDTVPHQASTVSSRFSAASPKALDSATISLMWLLTV